MTSPLTGIKVEMAFGIGPIQESDVALVLEFETETAGTSSAALGTGAFERSWTGLGWFTIEADPGGKIETGGIFADETVLADVWIDVSQYVTGVEIRHVKPSRFSSFDARTMSLKLLDDATRQWDPLNLSGPHVAGSTSLLREGLPVRVSYYDSVMGVTRWMFTGSVSSWPASFGTYAAADVTVECQDVFGILARGLDAPLAVAVGSGETVSTRIGRILDTAGVPAVERAIGVSAVTCQATTLDQSYISMLRSAAASDGGEIWVEPDGRVTFASWADLWQSDQRNRVQWTFTNNPTGATNECDYASDPSVSNDLRDTVTTVILQAVGGSPKTAEDSGLVTLYGTRVTSRSDLINLDTNDTVLNLAAAIIATQPTLPVRINQVVVSPHIHTEALNVAIRHRLWDRVSVVHQQITGSTVTRHGWIVGITHTINDSEWFASFALQDCTGLTAFTIEESAIAGTDHIA